MNVLGLKFFFIQTLVLVSMVVIRKRNIPKFCGLFIIAINTYFTIGGYKGNSYGVSNEFLVFSIFAINCIAAVILFYSDKLTKENLFFSVALILSPFMLAAGTSNPIFYTASQLIVFCVAGCFLLVLNYGSRVLEYFYSYCFVFLGIFIGSFLYHGMLTNPYRQTNLTEKSIALPQTRQIHKILESEERSDKYKELAGKLRMHNIDLLPVLASPPVLGGLMLTDMDPFAVCWISDPEEHAVANEDYFKRVNVKTNKPFLILAQQLYHSAKQQAIFKAGGMDLKIDYVMKDSIYLEWNKEYYYFMQPKKNTELSFNGS